MGSLTNTFASRETLPVLAMSVICVGDDPDFWRAFEDGEGMVIGDEPGNIR
jgi:hypothetical protein